MHVINNLIQTAMIKVTFNGKDAIKSQVFNNSITKVTLTGIMKVPSVYDLPSKVDDYMTKYTGVTAQWFNGRIYVSAIGISKKSKEDAYDETLGYRIAESRAKIKLYKFLLNACKVYCRYLRELCFGKYADIVVATLPKQSIGYDVVKYTSFLEREKQHLNTLIHGTDTESPQQS